MTTPASTSPSIKQLLRLQVMGTTTSGSRVVGPLVLNMVATTVLASFAYQPQSVTNLPLVYFMLWMIFGGQMGLFVAVGRQQGTPSRDYLRRLPIEARRCQFCETLLDLLFGAAPSLVGMIIVGFGDVGLGITLATVQTWGTVVGILTPTSRRKLIAYPLVYLLAALPGAIMGGVLLMTGAETWPITLTASFFGLSLLGAGYALLRPPAMHPESAPIAKSRDLRMNWPIELLPARTLSGLLTWGSGPLFTVWLMVAVGLTISAVLVPASSFVVLWAWILALQMATAVGLNLKRDTTEFLLTRPISRARYYATAVGVGVLATLLVPVSGWIVTQTVDDFRPFVDQHLHSLSYYPPGSVDEVDGAVREELDQRFRRRLAKAFWVRDLPEDTFDYETVREVGGYRIPGYDERLVEKCRAGLVDRWSFSILVTLAWFFGVLSLHHRMSFRGDRLTVRQTLTNWVKPKVLLIMGGLVGLTLPIFYEIPWSPAPAWSLAICVVVLAGISWKQLLNYEVS